MPQQTKKVKEPLPPLYFQDLAGRALAAIDTQMSKRYRNGNRFKEAGGLTIAKLVKRSGMTWWTIYRKLKRHSPISLEQLDKLMYAAEIDITDLLLTPEIAALYASGDPMFRYLIRQHAKKVVDKFEEAV